jgi:Zn-dependent M28 family amino/carboxypeptidase
LRIPGVDPGLGDEVVVVSAPLDHLGIARVGDRLGSDSIHNGADAATGAAALLEVVESLLKAPPRRSVLILWTVGSTDGRLGSEWFLDNSPVPLAKVIANINVDMIGRGSANDIAGGGPDYVQIAGAKRLSSQLDGWVHEVNRAGGFNFRIDTTFDAPGHPARYHCNGDHWNFLRHGIPSVFVTTGTHPDYHTVDDEIEKIDFDKYARVTEFITALVTEIADRPARPALDKPKPNPKAACIQ